MGRWGTQVGVKDRDKKWMGLMLIVLQEMRPILKTLVSERTKIK